MAALMVLDHLHYIPGLVSPFWEGIFHALTRCVAVWFAYTAVEGFVYTSNLRRYLSRLYGWALFMLAGNFILEHAFKYRVHMTNNIFLTLAVGVTLLSIFFLRINIADLREKLIRWIGGGLVFLIGIFLTEGGLVILPFMLITYAFREKILLRNSLYFALSAVLLLMSYQSYPTWSETLNMLLYNSDFLFISVLPFISLYNGERGAKTAFSKYFFYIFYPTHLWLIAYVAYLVSGS